MEIWVKRRIDKGKRKEDWRQIKEIKFSKIKRIIKTEKSNFYII
jgi:hypothetical protein